MQEIIFQMRKKKTDGKEKVKSLERLCQITKELNDELITIQPETLVKSHVLQYFLLTNYQDTAVIGTPEWLHASSSRSNNALPL